jgi:DNA-binding GntR family transcriptional regulator
MANTVAPKAGTKRAMIAHTLSSDIQEGKYPIGSALPSENELAQSFGVSRHTIRIALTTLLDTGLISSHQGVGNIVRASSVPVRYAQSFDSLDNILQYAANTPVEFTGKTEVVVNAALAAWLGCKQGERWWRVTTIRFSSGKKTRVAASEIFIPYMFGSILNHTKKSGGTLLTLIEGMLGKSIVEITQEITASKATAAEAKDLMIAPRDPVLRIVRRYFGEGRQLLEVSRSAHPAESFSYAMRVRLTMKSADG